MFNLHIKRGTLSFISFVKKRPLSEVKEFMNEYKFKYPNAQMRMI